MTASHAVALREPTSLVQVDDQCESVEVWAAGCESIGEVKDAADRLSALKEYAGRRSKEARARVAAAQRRLECRMGVLLGETEHGGDRRSDQVHRDELETDLFHKAQRWEYRAMAANLTIVEKVITDAGDNGYPSRRAVIAAIREAIAEEPEVANDTRRNVPSAERAAQIAELAATGHVASQIANEIGVSVARVHTLANQHGITLPDKAIGKRARPDSNRIVRETVSSAEGCAFGLNLIDYQELDHSQIEEWTSSLSESIRALNRLNTKLKELAS